MFVVQRGLDANTQGVEFLAALVGGLLSWLGDLLGPLGEGLVHRQAGRALAAGRVECSLKVISGCQQVCPHGGGAELRLTAHGDLASLFIIHDRQTLLVGPVRSVILPG
jgi:hypothetical protein